MKIQVKAKPGAKHAEVRVEKTEGLFTKGGEPRFTVAVKEPAVDGRANRAIAEALAEYFKVPVSRVRIVSGFTSREKVVEVG